MDRGGALARLAVAVMLVPMIAGCVDGGPETTDDAEDPLEHLRLDVPEPDLDRIADWHAAFVTDHRWRHTGSPTNWASSQQLIADLEDAGWDAELMVYHPPGERLDELQGTPLADTGVNVVLGTKPGTGSGHIGWVSHYDVVPQTVEGAYDDGSGVAVGIELARMFADVQTNKTLMAIFFDSEELGLVASDYFVQDAVADDTAAWHLVIGHDMVGINWPGHEWPMYQMVGEPHVEQLVPVQERLYDEVLGYPEDGVVVLDVHDRNSDERRFKDAGVPIIRMAGGRDASDYPQYHMPDDSLEYIMDFVGGEENWKAGLGTVLEATAYNIALFDLLPHPEDDTFPQEADRLFDRMSSRP